MADNTKSETVESSFEPELEQRIAEIQLNSISNNGKLTYSGEKIIMNNGLRIYRDTSLLLMRYYIIPNHLI